jgi:Zn-dependent protease
MFRSWNLGSVAGIRINLHGTFMLLLGFIVLSRLLSGGQGGMLYDLLTVGMLFGIVVLHELGHALTARRFGIETRDITLYPIGGVARLERMPERPVQEFAVALAGPAVNIALAALVIALESFIPSGIASLLARRFLQVNIALAVFNLLPAFPMDGGRVLRAALALRKDYVGATRIAAKVGRVMAVLFALVGFFNGLPMLVLIAAFVWIAGSAEERAVQARYAFRNSPFFRFVNTPRDDWWRFGPPPPRRTREAPYTVVDE